MLQAFQDSFVDPEDHSPLSFSGEFLNGACWHQGYLCSSRGEKWMVESGIPDFGAEDQGDHWTEEKVEAFLANGTYENNWENGRSSYAQKTWGFSAACRDAAERGRPIVDIASGPGGGMMPTILAFNPKITMLASDAGTPILHGWRQYLARQEIDVPICFAGFDATHMPLADDSVETITSAVGFSSIKADRLAGFREASRILVPGGMIYAAEVEIEQAGLKKLSAEMGWDYQARFGSRYAMSFDEMFEECGLSVLQERLYFRRKMPPGDNDLAEKACELGINLWVGGNVYWLTKQG